MQATKLVPRSTEHGLPSGQTGCSKVQAEDLWNGHGRSAYALACALLGDETAAKQAVVLGMTDFARSQASTSAGDTRRSLARHVYWRSTELASETSRTTGLPPTMAWLAQLAQQQRTSLALCAFGGHTYQEAADLLDIAPLTAAELLRSGLNELSGLSTPGIAVSA